MTEQTDLVEVVAGWLCTRYDEYTWSHLGSLDRGIYRDDARSLLALLAEAGVVRIANHPNGYFYQCEPLLPEVTP